VGRTNLVILGFGIFACVALSLMMGHVVTIKDKDAVHPALFELHNVFGDQVQRRPTLEIVERGQRKVAVLTVDPVEDRTADRLARVMGRYLVRFRGADFQFDAMEVNMRAKDGSDITYPIRVPGGMSSLDRRIAPKLRPAARDKVRGKTTAGSTARPIPKRNANRIPTRKASPPAKPAKK
jgi:hypothetical protein